MRGGPRTLRILVAKAPGWGTIQSLSPLHLAFGELDHAVHAVALLSGCAGSLPPTFRAGRPVPQRLRDNYPPARLLAPMSPRSEAK